MGGWWLAIAAGGFWAGIEAAGLGERGLGTGGAVFLLVSGCLALTAPLIIRPTRRRLPLLAAWLVAAFCAVGGGWSSLREARVRDSPLVHLVERPVRVIGSLSSDPEAHPLGWTASFDAGLVAWRTGNQLSSIRVRDPLWLEGRGPPPNLRSGDRVDVRGSVDLLHGEFGRYLLHRGYAATLQADEVEFAGPPRNPMLVVARAIRSGLRRSLGRVFPHREAGLLMGLALGDTSRLDPAIEEDFRATGLSHLTAVSGENLVMFLAPILAVVGLARLARTGRLVVGGAAIAFFVLLTGAEPSVLRAAAMAGIAMVGIFLGRPRSPPALMGGAVLGLLALNPTLVYSIGFQLSVAATTGMALLAGPIAERLRWMPSWLALPAGTTIGAQAGVTPLLLYHFGLVPTVTILANVLAFPAVGPGMLLGLAAGAAALVWLPLGFLLASLARIPLRYLEALSHGLARSPLPWITSSGGQALTLLCGLVAVAGAGWWLRRARRLPASVLVVAGLVLPLFVWSGAVRAGPPSAFTVTFFDVGQGDAALVRSPSGASILIDAGPQPDEVARKLAALGIRRIDLAVATHPHADHVAGFPSVLARFRVALMVDPGCGGDSPYYAAFLRSVRAAGIPFQHPRAGSVLLVGDIRLEVLGPERCFVGTDSDPNNDSMVLRVSLGAASVLFPGDAERDNQTDLLRDFAGSLAAQVLKVPHHGGDTSLESFVGAIHARVAVVSVGPNRYGQPRGARVGPARPRRDAGHPDRPGWGRHRFVPGSGAPRRIGPWLRSTLRHPQAPEHPWVLERRSSELPSAPSVILFWGEDDFLLRQAALEFVAAQGAHATEIEATEWQGGELFDLATPSLWGDRRALLISGAQHLSEAGVREVRSYLESPSPDALCVLTLVTRGKGPALAKAVQGAGGLARQVAIRRQDLPKWILERSAAKQWKVTPAGAAAMVATLGEDPATLHQAIEQLAAAFPQADIGPEQVRAQFEGMGEQRVWDLCDRAFSGRGPEAQVVLRSLLAGRDDPLLILGGIASRLRDLLKVQALPDRMPPAEAAGAAGLRFDWQVRRYREQARRYSPAELAEVHRRLVEADRALKGGAAGDVVMAALVATISGEKEAALDFPVRVSR